MTSSSTTPKNVAEARRRTSTRLRTRGIEAASRESDWMLCHVLACSSSELAVSLNRTLKPTEIAQLESIVARRIAGEPLQYVLGDVDFYGLRLEVSPDVLIPRPETEGLVERVLRFLPARDVGPAADIGTGSGCIALALARERPQLRVAAVDSSLRALRVAAENAARLGLAQRIRFIRGDGAAPLRNRQPGFRVLVSNPPYVDAAERDQLPPEVVQYEPHQALFAGRRGMAVIERLIKQAAATVDSGGLLALEIGESQGTRVLALLEGGPWMDIRIEKDLAGRDRYALALRTD